MKMSDVHSAYFVGIGGIGMSALARYFHARGIAVSGYDRTPTELTDALQKEGISIHFTPDISRVPETADLAVYTPAVPADQAELVYLRQREIPLMKRAEVLGLISRDRRTIAVAGTHGKTTTSSLLAYVLHQGGIDCTAFLGGIARDFGSNFVAGESDWVVVEADEYDRSFLHLSPEIAVILSIEPDHLDIYGNAEQILETGFRAFARRIRPSGTLWVNRKVSHELGNPHAKRTFGLGKGEVRAEDIRVEDGAFVFDLVHRAGTCSGLRLSMPGRHNVENAVAALAVAFQLGVSEADARRALRQFGGITRRFERLYEDGQRVYIDDYAHHPSELEAAIQAARELYPGRHITVIFQPHLYSRTRDFAQGFGQALSLADRVLLLDIYPAREAPIEGVSADMLLPFILDTEVQRVKSEAVLDALMPEQVEVLLTLGAGDIDRLRQPLGHWLRTLSPNPKSEKL